MDDHDMITMPGGVLERIPALFKFFRIWGVFRPVNIMHMGVFYTIFQDHPRWFYIFRWFEVVAALSVWGWLAALITGQKAALPLLVCITLSFFNFYDAFFFLSSQEYLGLLLTGCAGVCFYKGFFPTITGKGVVSWPWVWWGLLWLLLGFGSKETFLVVGLAWGLALICAGISKPRSRRLWAFGSALVLGSLVYGLLLKCFATTAHTASYVITDFGKIAENAALWARYSLLHHTPWIVIAVVFLVFGKAAGDRGQHRFWAVILGAGLYIGYVLVLLPWYTVGFFSTPLGLFLAFLITVLIASRLERMNAALFASFLAAVLALNMLVSAFALQAAETYQQDSASLVKWLATNTQFEYEVNQNGAVVRSNAMEPGGSIPGYVKLFYGKTYEPFIFTPKVREILADIRTRYYLYGPNWGDQDLSRLGKMWYPVFVSQNWIMFRRLY
jgi:hypothetical protein